MDIFKDLDYLGIALSKAEKDLGMPVNYLCNIKAGRRKLPKKWVLPLQEYTLREFKIMRDRLVGESSGKPMASKIEPSVIASYDADKAPNYLGDEAGQWQTAKPLTCEQMQELIERSKVQGDELVFLPRKHQDETKDATDKPSESGLTAFQLALRKKRFGF